MGKEFWFIVFGYWLLFLVCVIHKSRITQVANICFAPPSRSPALKGDDGGAFIVDFLRRFLPSGSGKRTGGGKETTCGSSLLEFMNSSG
jgi:hypothetical protein